MLKLNFLLQPKKLAFKVESSPEDENLDTSALSTATFSATKSAAMDSSLGSNGGHLI